MRRRTSRATLILSIDQAEELFLTEGQDEAQALLALLCGLMWRMHPRDRRVDDRLRIYEHLQESSSWRVRKLPPHLAPCRKARMPR